MRTERNEVELFEAALEYPEAERSVFLRDACGEDHDLRERLNRYLQAHHTVSGPLDQSVAGMGSVLSDLSANHRLGDRVGPYKLIEQIGVGGMGIVYMAEQRESVKRMVALKIIKPGMDTEQVVARFEAERQALALMNHPNIAKVLDAGSTEAGLPFFAMELVKGIPVTEYCDKHRFDTRTRLELFIQICRAVQHAHLKGVIHRDLKPSNVLVELHDVHPVPKVIDFGVAKATNQSLTDRSLHTGFSQMIGTPMYMSPEQAQLSSLDVDARSDIYSLGATAFFLLTGKPPFDHKSLRDCIHAHLNETPVAPSTLQASVPEELDAVVLRCLAKSPADRFADSRDLAKALAECEFQPPWDHDRASEWWAEVEAAAESSVNDEERSSSST